MAPPSPAPPYPWLALYRPILALYRPITHMHSSCVVVSTLTCGGVKPQNYFLGQSPPPLGGEAPSNVGLVMSARVFTLNPMGSGYSLSARSRERY